MSHRSLFGLVMALSMTLGSTAALADLVRVESAHPVSVTIDRLAAVVEKAGAKVFARIDHAKGAKSVDLDLPPATALIFGNPKLGTPAMQGAATMGLDLPLRVLAYQDGDGDVWIAYHDPKDVAALHGLSADHPVVGKMTGALKKLTAGAAGN